MGNYDIPDSRKKAWLSLSDLFLDTDTNLLIDSVARNLASTPYDIKEIENILKSEIYPCCKYNLWSIAGEWEGFDEEWLVTQASQKRNSISLAWNRFFANIGIMVSPEWKKIRRKIEEIRSGNAA